MSSRLGAEGCAPSFVTESAAAAFAKRTASRSGRPSTRATASAPQWTSPAAVVSTASTGEAGHEGAHAVAGHVRAARAEGEDDRLRPLREERLGRRLDVFVARRPSGRSGTRPPSR